MAEKEFKDWKIVVVGAGTMGVGIAETYAAYGCKVSLVDISNEQLKKARNRLADNYRILRENELWDNKKIEVCKSNLSLMTMDKLPEHAKDCDMAIECVFEDAKVKKEVFAKLDKYCPENCILSSNTSGMNVFEVVNVSHPERLIITHWFNPPYIMKLVEVVMGPKTSEKTMNTAKEFLTAMGKSPAILRKYVPGFIVNRIHILIYKEIGYMIQQGWTDAQSADTALQATDGVRFAAEGPMRLGDIVGWDLYNTIAKEVIGSFCPDKGNTIPYADELIKKNEIGIKTGKGAYDYANVDINELYNKRSEDFIKMYKAIQNL